MSHFLHGFIFNFAVNEFVRMKLFTLRKKLIPTDSYLKTFFLNGAIVIDLRPRTAYQNEHVANTINIPFEQIQNAIPVLLQIKRIYILVCETGAASSIAVNMLRAVGIEAYNGGS